MMDKTTKLKNPYELLVESGGKITYFEEPTTLDENQMFYFKNYRQWICKNKDCRNAITGKPTVLAKIETNGEITQFVYELWDTGLKERLSPQKLGKPLIIRDVSNDRAKTIAKIEDRYIIVCKNIITKGNRCNYENVLEFRVSSKKM